MRQVLEHRGVGDVRQVGQRPDLPRARLAVEEVQSDEVDPREGEEVDVRLGGCFGFVGAAAGAGEADDDVGDAGMYARIKSVRILDSLRCLRRTPR